MAKKNCERSRGKRKVDEPGSVVLIIVSASIVPDRRLQVQPGTSSIATSSVLPAYGSSRR